MKGLAWMTECEGGKWEMDDECLRESEGPMGNRSTHPHVPHVRWRRLITILLFSLSLLALAPDFAPPARGRLEPVVRGECSDTPVGEHYGPDAQKEGELRASHDDGLSAVCCAACAARTTTIAARCQQLVGLYSEETETEPSLPAGAADGKERKRKGKDHSLGPDHPRPSRSRSSLPRIPGLFFCATSIHVRVTPDRPDPLPAPVGRIHGSRGPRCYELRVSE